MAQMSAYHPEYAKAIAPMLPTFAKFEKLAVHDVEGRRARSTALLVSLRGATPVPDDVEIIIHQATARDGTSIPIHHYRMKSANTQAPQSSLPAILYTHGGGHMMFSATMYDPALANLASVAGIQMFSVDYRLSPEHPFPTGPEDCYTGLEWLHEHANDFNIDRSRIAVFGDSAGGGLAASVALMARDRKLSPPLAKQILVYPMLDDRTNKESPIEHLFFWTTADNTTGWTAYLGEKAGGEGVSHYAAPARVESVVGLPPTYMDVGTLDRFREEDIQYAARIAAANIPIEFHLYPGLPHAFELIAQGSDIVNTVIANRVKAMTSF